MTRNQKVNRMNDCFLGCSALFHPLVSGARTLLLLLNLAIQLVLCLFLSSSTAGSSVAYAATRLSAD